MQIITVEAGGGRRVETLEALMQRVDLKARGAATFHVTDRAELFALLHRAVEAGVAPVLFDPKMESIAERVAEFGIPSHDAPREPGTMPEGLEYALFFTSGTTGEPTGALKSRENIEAEVRAQKALFGPEGYERVIVTVPFIHIYGFLAGVMLPRALGCEVLFKEEFWPQELLELHEEKKTLVVTSPVYIKSLLKLRRARAIPNVHFLSSTGLLLEEEVEAFETKYETTLIQLFGSTETGGIATKRGVTPWWTPLEGVTVHSDAEGVMLVDSPYVSQRVLETALRTLPHPFRTSDLVTIEGGRFKLEGRLSEIVKISGKRLSVSELEQRIEKELGVREALIRLERDSSRLKDESLRIEIAGNDAVGEAEVAALLRTHYPNIHFQFRLEHVDAVAKNAMGKKVRR